MSNIVNLKPWPKGVSGNPAGRPRGSRSRLTEDFLGCLAADFEVHGVNAIEEARVKDPVQYIKIIAGLCPRELDLKTPIQALTDEELLAAVDTIRSFIDGSKGHDDASSGSDKQE